MNEKNCGFRVTQVKGKINSNDVSNSDVISSIRFNSDGSMLAVGDRGGRVVVFSPNHHKYSGYSMYSTFQSHEPDFDYLKSVEIEERINELSWLEPYHHSNYLLTTNDKTVKLFRISDTAKSGVVASGRRQSHIDSTLSFEGNLRKKGKLSRESSFSHQPVHDAKCKRVFANAHHFNIHSVSACINQEYFISADDLRINLWSFERSDTCFTIVDIKPENMDNLNEIITTAQFHRSQPDIFMYTTSKGLTKLCDTRESAICDVPSLVFDDLNSYGSDSQFSEATLTISSFDFARDSNVFLTRDYLNVNVWDMRMNRNTLEIHLIQEFLNHNDLLNSMYEQDCLFDKFEARFSQDDRHVVTGTYNHMFAYKNRSNDDSDLPLYYWADMDHIHNRHNVQKTLEAYHITGPVTMSTKHDDQALELDVHDLKFHHKISSLDCHPTEDIIALAVEHSLLFLNSNQDMSF